MKQKTLMNKVYESKIFWIVVSVVCSLAIWVYISAQEPADIKMKFSGVQVVFSGEDELAEAHNLSIVDVDTSSVTLTLRGSRSVLGKLSSSDIKAVVDVSSITQASDMVWNYSIVFPDSVNADDIEIVDKSPDTISFRVVENASKTIPVKGTFQGHIADDCAAEEITFDPESITIEGPAEYISKISYALVEFGEGEISSTYSEQCEFKLMDANNNECSFDGIKTSVDKILATQPILKSKTVPLKVELVSGGGISASDCTVTIEPESITLAGDSRILDDMESIVLGTIDLASFQNSYEETFEIPVDEKLQNLTGTDEAKVTVTIAGTHTKTFTTDNISCKNVTDGYKATIDTTEVDVTLRAKSMETLENINADNISVVADLSDYGATTGQVIVYATVNVSGYNDVGAVGDVKVTVTITKE